MKPKERINRIKKHFKKHKKELIVILGVIVLLILVLNILKALNKTKVGNSISNLQNQGMVVTKENNYYYKKLSKDKSYIYSLKKNKEEAEKLIKSDNSYLNSYKNYLYFIEKNEETTKHNIIKLKHNGKKKEKLVEDVDNRQLLVANDWVYYFKDNVLYRIRINGKDIIKVSEDGILNYGINKDYIYYVYNNGEKNILARRKIEEKMFTNLVQNVSEDFEIIDNKIYFVEQKYNQTEYTYNYALYRVKLNGEGKRKIADLPKDLKNVNILEDKVFYTIQNEAGETEVYSLNYKEKESALIVKTLVDTPICISNNLLFYMDTNDEGNTVIKSKQIN